LSPKLTGYDASLLTNRLWRLPVVSGDAAQQTCRLRLLQVASDGVVMLMMPENLIVPENLLASSK
jgi:hypothetical protein